PKHWAHTAQAASRLSHALPGIYTDLDAALSALVKNVPDDATILIVSVHGIEANYSGNHLMPAVLAKLGFQANANAATSESRRSLHAFKRFVPDRVKAAVNAYLLPDSFHDRVRSRTFSRSIDWDKTRAFFIPSDQFQGFISINLKDREPYGTIRPGREYEELCGQICYELGRLTNPQSGKPALREVVQTAKLYGFDSLSALPDIVLCWSKDGPINQLFHPSFGAIEGHTAALRRTQHSGYGFLIAAGAHTNKDGGPAQATILDLAPTILYLLGQPVPSDMDGRVLLELIDEDYRIRHPVQYGQGSGAAAEPTLASKKRQP
ncbi:MAG TPA: hypothetical protein VNO43_05510, partial [Candidatus Eisenbacteria bacterium]|nr:hypothetical protein [Candidatus Eisenbacteria bacterium]